MLKGKTVLLGVSGSIAAYKSAALASMLTKMQADVHVIMTKNAAQFITPLTFEAITKNKCLLDTFDRNFEYTIGHVALGEKADIMLIAPASADVIAKAAAGICDDMLTTTILACRGPVVFVPAMNTAMYEKAVTQENLRKLQKNGMDVMEPVCGRLACGSIGMGKMPEPEEIAEYAAMLIERPKILQNSRILVSAGPTQEKIDPVRFISNHSSGKMGFALCKEALAAGAKVTLISGPTNLVFPRKAKGICVTTAEEMAEAVQREAKEAQIVIMAAAVADYTPQNPAEEKIKKKEKSGVLQLERTKDILKELGHNKNPEQFLCGLSMETENMLENTRKKLLSKNLDMMVANNLKTEGAGFQKDTNQVTIMTRDQTEELPLLSKEETAWRILEAIKKRM